MVTQTLQAAAEWRPAAVIDRLRQLLTNVTPDADFRCAMRRGLRGKLPDHGKQSGQAQSEPVRNGRQLVRDHPQPVRH